MNVMWCVLLCALAQVHAEFFHEPSRIRLSASGAMESDFGLSMGFQDAPPRLVVGAPRKDDVGQIYNCSLTDLSRDRDCSMFDMSDLNIEKNSNDARMGRDPKQKYYMGSTIAATSDYFLTCAPLLPKLIRYGKKRKSSIIPVAGSCYLHDNSSGFSEWKDTVYKIQNEIKTRGQPRHKKLIDMVKGDGFGWNTLVDTDNGFLIVAKPTYPVDIQSVHANDPSAQSLSLLNKDEGNNHTKLSNTGYGMAVGNFFDKLTKLYAISTQHQNLKGSILFLKETNNVLNILKNETSNDWIDLKNNDQGTMFGYALAAADINHDGVSELVVGAPAQPNENNKQEFGAIHIYIGGDVKTLNDRNRMRTIIGTHENGRFGSAIATTDIDGDNLSEIIVGAPYENNGNGAVYVISGFELNRAVLNSEARKMTRLTDLKLTQHLRGDASSMHYGFSVHVVRDLDRNGCVELAIGSPASSQVQLLRCLPAVTAGTTLQIIGDEIVKEDAKSFKVKVCLNVTIHQNCESLIGTIVVKSQITGGTYLSSPPFSYEIKNYDNKEQQTCEEVTVYMNKSGSSEFIFSTHIEVADNDTNGNRADKAYKSWAVLSAYSKLENSLPVKRYCTGTECEPKLNLTMTWTGDAMIDSSSTASKNQSFIIKVNNTGPDVKTASVRVILKGARISQLTEQCFENGVDEYSCALPKPLQRNRTFTITVFVNTTEVTNVPNLELTAQLYDEVFKKITYDPVTLKVPFVLDTDSVLVNGSNHNLQITDKDMQDSQIVSFNDNHEYYIINNGVVTWQYITAVLKIKKEPFIQNVKTLTTESCVKQPASDSQKQSIFVCALTLRPGETKKITASLLISKKSIATDISKSNLKTSSTLSVQLHPTAVEKQAMLSTQMKYKEILEVGNNMPLIILIVSVVAVALLLLISFVLYKCGFFKRAEKQKLDVLRKSVRQRSIRKESGSVRSHKPSTAEENNCEIIEVLDDCVFQEIDIRPQTEDVATSKDNVDLINNSPKLKHTS